MMDSPLVRDLRDWLRDLQRSPLRYGKDLALMEELAERSIEEIEKLERALRTARNDTLEAAARIADESPFDIGIAPKIRKLRN